MLDDGCEVVARPFQVIVLFVPPTSAPIVPVTVKGPENECVVVAIVPRSDGYAVLVQ